MILDLRCTVGLLCPICSRSTCILRRAVFAGFECLCSQFHVPVHKLMAPQGCERETPSLLNQLSLAPHCTSSQVFIQPCTWTCARWTVWQEHGDTVWPQGRRENEEADKLVECGNCNSSSMYISFLGMFCLWMAPLKWIFYSASTFCLSPLYSV